MLTAQISTQRDLYRRIRKLSDADIELVSRYIDDIEEKHKPNAETIAAFREGEQMLKDPKALRFSNIDDLMAELAS